MAAIARSFSAASSAAACPARVMVKVVLLPTWALLEARLREESPRTSSTLSHSYPSKLGRHPGGGRVGIGAEVADPGVDVQPPVGRDAHEPVLAARTRPVVGLADPHPGHARSAPLAAAGAPLLPSEALGALGERLSQMSAGDGAPDLRRRGSSLSGALTAADGQLGRYRAEPQPCRAGAPPRRRSGSDRDRAARPAPGVLVRTGIPRKRIAGGV